MLKLGLTLRLLRIEFRDFPRGDILAYRNKAITHWTKNKGEATEMRVHVAEAYDRIAANMGLFIDQNEIMGVLPDE